MGEFFKATQTDRNAIYLKELQRNNFFQVGIV
jgi:hypothetical protein